MKTRSNGSRTDIAFGIVELFAPRWDGESFMPPPELSGPETSLRDEACAFLIQHIRGQTVEHKLALAANDLAGHPLVTESKSPAAASETLQQIP